MDILIADDHALYRDLMRAKLESTYPETTFHESENYSQTISACAEFKPKLLILDLFMPGMSVFMGAFDIAQQFQDTAILICSALENPILVCTIIDFGIKGYITKSMPANLMMEGIEKVLNGGTYVPKQYLSNSIRLTRRQCEILGMIFSGLSNKEIAALLKLSVITVKFHIGQILEALGVKNRQQAMALCGLA